MVSQGRNYLGDREHTGILKDSSAVDEWWLLELFKVSLNGSCYFARVCGSWLLAEARDLADNFPMRPVHYLGLNGP
jgi:hypothetical protein